MTQLAAQGVLASGSKATRCRTEGVIRICCLFCLSFKCLLDGLPLDPVKMLHKYLNLIPDVVKVKPVYHDGLPTLLELNEHPLLAQLRFLFEIAFLTIEGDGGNVLGTLVSLLPFSFGPTSGSRFERSRVSLIRISWDGLPF